MTTLYNHIVHFKKWLRIFSCERKHVSFLFVDPVGVDARCGTISRWERGFWSGRQW